MPEVLARGPDGVRAAVQPSRESPRRPVRLDLVQLVGPGRPFRPRGLLIAVTLCPLHVEAAAVRTSRGNAEGSRRARPPGIPERVNGKAYTLKRNGRV